MIFLIIGFAFVFIDFGIMINELGGVEIFPDFVGWFLVFYGLIRLSPYGRNFSKVKYLSLATGLLSVIIWVLDIIGVTKFFGVFSLPLMGILCFFTLFILYRIIEGIGDAENDNNADYGSKRLFKLFLPLCISQSIGLIASVLGMDAIMIAAYVVLTVCTVLLIVFMNGTRKAMDEKPPKIRESEIKKADRDDY